MTGTRVNFTADLLPTGRLRVVRVRGHVDALLGGPVADGDDLAELVADRSPEGDAGLRAVLAGLRADGAASADLTLGTPGHARAVRLVAVAEDGDGVPSGVVRVTGVIREVTAGDRDAPPDTAGAGGAGGDAFYEVGRVAGVWEPLSMGPGVGRLLGGDVAPRDLPGRFWAAVHPDDRARLLGRVEAVRAGVDVEPVEVRVIRDDGRVVWVRADHRRRVARNGDLRVRAVLTDVTERVRDAQALTMLREAFDAEVGEVLIRHDGGLEFPDRADADRWRGVVASLPAGEVERLVDAVRAGNTGGMPGEPVFHVLVDHARRRRLMLRVQESTPSGLRTAIAVGGMPDTAVAATEPDRLRVMFDMIGEVVVAGGIDPDGRWRIDHFNHAAEVSWGMSPGDDPYEVVPGWVARVHPDDRAALEADMRLLESGRSVSPRFRVIRPGGDVRRMRFATTVIDRGPHGVRFVAVGIDETEAAERAEGLRAALAATGQSVFRGRLSGADLLVTWTAPEGDAEPVDRLGPEVPEGADVHPDDVEAYRRWAREAASGSRPAQFEYRGRGRSGQVPWRRDTIVPLGDGEVAGIVTEVPTPGGTAGPVPAPVRFEAEVHPGRVWEVFAEGGGPPSAIGPGFDDDPARAGARMMDAVHPSDRDRVRALAAEVVTHGDPVRVEYRVVRRSGEVRWKRAILTRRSAADGRVRVAGVVVDITGDRDRQGRIARIVDTVDPAVIEMHVDAGGRIEVPYASAGLARLLQRVPSEAPADRGRDLLHALHGDDRSLLVVAASQAVDDGAASARLRVLRPDGRMRSVEVRLELAERREGAAVLCGVLVDVSGRGREDGMLGRVLDAVNDAAFEAEVGGGTVRVRHASVALARLLGQAVVGGGASPGHLLSDALVPEDRAELLALLQVASVTDGTVTRLLRLVRPDGGTRTLRAVAARIGVEDDHATVGCVLRDITDLGEPWSEPDPLPAGDGDPADDEFPDGCPLTERQLAVLRLIGTGAGTEDVAARLGIRPVTVANHVAAILRRMNARSRLEAVARARRLRYID